MEPSIDINQQITILVEELKTRENEKAQFNSSLTNSLTFGSSILVFVYYLSTSTFKFGIVLLPFFILTFLTLEIFRYNMLYYNSRYIALIENRINTLAGCKLLLWENYATPDKHLGLHLFINKDENEKKSFNVIGITFYFLLFLLLFFSVVILIQSNLWFDENLSQFIFVNLDLFSFFISIKILYFLIIGFSSLSLLLTFAFVQNKSLKIVEERWKKYLHENKIKFE